MADDRELMARVREGEQTALELLFTRWEGRLFAFFYRLGCPPSLIEDLTEEALVILYRQRHRYDPARPFPPWLFGIANLVWKDHLRHRRRETLHTAPLEAARPAPAGDPTPADAAEAREQADAVRGAAEELPEEQRACFILRHYHGLSYKEIAEALGVPLGTVKWRIHEAVRRIQASISAMQRNRVGD